MTAKDARKQIRCRSVAGDPRLYILASAPKARRRLVAGPASARRCRSILRPCDPPDAPELSARPTATILLHKTCVYLLDCDFQCCLIICACRTSNGPGSPASVTARFAPVSCYSTLGASGEHHSSYTIELGAHRYFCIFNEILSATRVTRQPMLLDYTVKDFWDVMFRSCPSQTRSREVPRNSSTPITRYERFSPATLSHINDWCLCRIFLSPKTQIKSINKTARQTSVCHLH